jgi:hypothetical protein
MMPDWQSMKCAPRDGTAILLVVEGWEDGEVIRTDYAPANGHAWQSRPGRSSRCAGCRTCALLHRQ